MQGAEDAGLKVFIVCLMFTFQKVVVHQPTKDLASHASTLVEAGPDFKQKTLNPQPS